LDEGGEVEERAIGEEERLCWGNGHSRQKKDFPGMKQEGSGVKEKRKECRLGREGYFGAEDTYAIL